MVLKNFRRRRMNLNVSWIDSKKAYDMVPHSWILESVTLVLMMRVVNLWRELKCGHSPRWRDHHKAVRERQGIDSRDEVRHNEKTFSYS